MLIIKKLRNHYVTITFWKELRKYHYRFLVTLDGKEVFIEGCTDELLFGQDIQMYASDDTCYWVKFNASTFKVSYGDLTEMLIGTANIVICK